MKHPALAGPLFALGFGCQATYSLTSLIGEGCWRCMHPEMNTCKTLFRAEKKVMDNIFLKDASIDHPSKMSE